MQLFTKTAQKKAINGGKLGFFNWPSFLELLHVIPGVTKVNGTLGASFTGWTSFPAT